MTRSPADEGEKAMRPEESCKHEHVDDERIRFVRGTPPPSMQIGYCHDCGFHVWRRVQVSAWTIDPRRAA